MDYSKTKIYKIYSHLGDKIYIGSTTKEYLSQRFATHKRGYKLYNSGNTKYGLVRSYLLFDEYGVDNCLIELIDAKECSSIDEKNRLEGSYIKSMNCVNKIISGNTQKEYREDNKEKIKERKKNYYESKKEDILKNAKLQYEKTKDEKNKTCICECGREVILRHKKKHELSRNHKLN